MHLRYICFRYDDINQKKFEFSFEYFSRFICNYLQRRIRSYKFQTDGTFNTLCIVLGEQRNPEIIYGKSLQIYLPLNKKRYLTIRGTDDYSYYIELLRNAFDVAANIKDFPKEILNKYLDEFVKNGYTNEWTYFKQTLKSLGIRLVVKATFTTFQFSLTAQFYNINSKALLCEGRIISTMPEEIFFHKELRRNVTEEDDKICFYSPYNPYAFIIFKISDIRMGKFKFKYGKIPKWDIFRLEIRQSEIDTTNYSPNITRLNLLREQHELPKD